MLVGLTITAHGRRLEWTLTDAIVAAERSSEPIRLLLNYQGGYNTIAVDYHGGLQYPHLVRANGSPDYLDEIIAARK
jgi:hypothetical protein